MSHAAGLITLGRRFGLGLVIRPGVGRRGSEGGGIGGFGPFLTSDLRKGDADNARMMSDRPV